MVGEYYFCGTKLLAKDPNGNNKLSYVNDMLFVLTTIYEKRVYKRVYIVLYCIVL